MTTPTLLANEAATQAWATRLAQAITTAHTAAHQQHGHWSMHLDLVGNLGAGKTTLVRHLLRALGVAGRVKSPTYTVMEPYSVALPDAPDLAVSHFDLYRFADPREWADAGFRDVWAAPGLKLVEWPEKGAGALPAPDVRIELRTLSEDASADTRELRWQALTQAGQTLDDLMHALT